MDEVGAMVAKITKEGFIKMLPIGGCKPKYTYLKIWKLSFLIQKSKV